MSGSFTAAATRLSITSAAVGKNVMRLEQELGVRLFHRSTRRLSLTTKGEIFLAEAGEALRNLDNAVENASRAASEPSGKARISSGITFGRRFVLPMLADMAKRYPQLQLELDLNNREIDPIEDGYDICVRGGHMQDSSLVARRICRLYGVVVASPAYLSKYGVPQSPDHLSKHTVLGVRFNSGEIAPWRFRKPSGRGMMDWTPTARIWTSDPESFLDLAVAGEGICQAWLMHVAPLLRSGKLRVILHHQYDHGEKQMMLCYPNRKLLSKRVRVVVDELIAGLDRHPDLHLDPQNLQREWIA